MTRPLEGRTVALAESRQLEELAQLLEKEGARTIRCPLVGILDAPDAGPVLDWLRDLSAGTFGTVVLMTGGVGGADFRGLLETDNFALLLKPFDARRLKEVINFMTGLKEEVLR